MNNVIATRTAFGEALVEMAKERKDIVVLDADVATSTKTSIFREAFPERFFEMGIAEQNMMGVAAGMATTQKIIPFAVTFAVFATKRACDQVSISIAYPKLIHTIKPIDKDILLKASIETGHIVTVENHSIIGGLGGAVAEFLSESEPALIKRIGMEDIFGESGSLKGLFCKYGLTSKNIVKVVEESIKEKTNKLYNF